MHFFVYIDKKCKVGEVWLKSVKSWGKIKAMFKDIEIDLNKIETNELQNFMI